MTTVNANIASPRMLLVAGGAVKQVAEVLAKFGLSRPLVVTDPMMVKLGLVRRCLDPLEAAGLKPGVFSDTVPEPVDTVIDAGVAVLKAGDYDCMIGFGGGSPIDTAKAMAILAQGGGRMRDYKAPFAADKGAVPVIAIPTTAGTGSEVGRSSVITLDATHRKAVLFNPEMLAKLVILDPALTVGLPPHLTAATGADALTHCIESFTCPSFHPMCDGIALEGARLIFEALPKAYRNGQDLEARGHMLVAAAMGAVAFQKDLGVVHSLAHPLSSICGMHHGLANALCLVASMRFCSERRPGLYRRVGQAAGLEVTRLSDAEADRVTIAFVESFLAGLGLDKKLSQCGVKPEHLDALVAQAWEDPCHRTNAVPVTAADLRALYLQVL